MPFLPRHSANISPANQDQLHNHDIEMAESNDGAPPPYNPGPPSGGAAGGGNESSEHLNIKVTDNNNEVFFKIRRTTALKKLMDAFCDRQGKTPSSVRFLFEGVRVNAQDTPDSVSHAAVELSCCAAILIEGP